MDDVGIFEMNIFPLNILFMKIANINNENMLRLFIYSLFLF